MTIRNKYKSDQARKTKNSESNIDLPILTAQCCAGKILARCGFCCKMRGLLLTQAPVGCRHGVTILTELCIGRTPFNILHLDMQISLLKSY